MSTVHWDRDALRSAGWDEPGPPAGARHHIAEFGRALARASMAAGVQVVLAKPTGWYRQVVSTGQPAPLALDLVDLLVPSECVVVPVERMPSPGARAAAAAWETDRLLVAPALFGHELLAVGLAAIPALVTPDLAAAERAGERMGATLTAYRLGLAPRLVGV